MNHVIERLGGEDALWRLLQSRIAAAGETNDTTPESRPSTPGPEDQER